MRSTEIRGSGGFFENLDPESAGVSPLTQRGIENADVGQVVPPVSMSGSLDDTSPSSDSRTATLFPPRWAMSPSAGAPATIDVMRSASDGCQYRNNT